MRRIARRPRWPSAVEVRTINSRYFKLAIRCGEGYGSLEPQIEALVRQHIKRGTVQVSLRIDRARARDDYRLNTEVLAGYRRAAGSTAQRVEHGRADAARSACCRCPAWWTRRPCDRSTSRPIGR